MNKQLKGFLGWGSPRKVLVFVNCRGPGLSRRGLRRARDDVTTVSLELELSDMCDSERRMEVSR